MQQFLATCHTPSAPPACLIVYCGLHCPFTGYLPAWCAFLAAFFACPAALSKFLAFCTFSALLSQLVVWPIMFFVHCTLCLASFSCLSLSFFPCVCSLPPCHSRNSIFVLSCSDWLLTFKCQISSQLCLGFSFSNFFSDWACLTLSQQSAVCASLRPLAAAATWLSVWAEQLRGKVAASCCSCNCCSC